MMILPTMVAGDTPVDTWTLALPNNAVQDLTGVVGSNLTLILRELQNGQPTGTAIEGMGTFTVVTPAEGVVTYAWNPNDSAKPGMYQIAVKVQFSGGQVLTFGVVNRVTQIIVPA